MADNTHSVPPSIGAAAQQVLAARGQAERLRRAFGRTFAPMVLVDGERRYVHVNNPARLALRLSAAEILGSTIDDLTPVHARSTVEAAWSRLIETGCVSGTYEVAARDGSRFEIVYCGAANALPGLHLIAFAPAGWPDDELITGEVEPAAPLTPREREVLALAAEGHTGRAIAERLVLSPATVKTHFGHIYEKLGARDRAAAVATAMRLRLID
jgi:PAS domain S-box-containing protein